MASLPGGEVTINPSTSHRELMNLLEEICETRPAVCSPYSEKGLKG